MSDVLQMNEYSRVEAMLKHSRKALLQRQNKPLAKHANETMNAERLRRPVCARSTMRSQPTAMQTSCAAIQLLHLMTAHMEYSNET